MSKGSIVLWPVSRNCLCKEFHRTEGIQTTAEVALVYGC